MINFEVFGGAKEFVNCRAPEVMIHGPAETGKTIAALYKLHIAASTYKKASIVICRKTLSSTYSTVLQTFINKVLPPEDELPAYGIEPYGGKKPEWFDYHNTGARIWLAGMEKSSRILSAEHDIIYINQAEEASLDDWETCTTRTTGRAGNMPYSQTIGDMNPAYPQFWSYHRPSLKLFYSRHSENPALYNQHTNKITEQGKRTMTVLNNLSGLRRTRLRDGKPALAEGAIYAEWDDSVHLIDKFAIPKDWRRFRAIDFGYTNPFVCQWWAMDNDNRLYLYREIYYTRRTVKVCSKQINELSKGEHIEATICDHDAEDRATLRENGISNLAAKKAVSVGIEKVIEMLKKRDDKRPALYIMRDSLVEIDPALERAQMPISTVGEIAGYVWANHKTKEVPVKEDDHGMDAMRYMVMQIARGGIFFG